MTSIQEKQPLPAFELPLISRTNGEWLETTISNAPFAGKEWILFVYPRDNTSGCTLEACGFRDLYQRFAARGVEIVGISRDSVRSHRGFIEKQELPYPLLADNGGAWLRENGLIYDTTMYGKPVTKVRRTTIWIGADGLVRRVWEDVKPPGHALEVCEAVEKN